MFKTFIYFIVSILIIELIFNTVGFTLSIPQNYLNSVKEADSKKLRILTLGESTSADYFASSESGPWPRVLENKLNQIGVLTRVYNESVGGTNSLILVAKLDNFIERYQPHIVVTMMGINDTYQFFWNEDSDWIKKIGFDQLKIFKVYKWIHHAIDSASSCKIKEFRRDYDKVEYLTQKGIKLSSQHTPYEVKELLKNEVDNSDDLSFALREIGVFHRGNLNYTNDLTIARIYHKLAFELQPYDEMNAFWMINVPNYEHCKILTDKLLECGVNIPDSILSEIAHCGHFIPSIKDHPTFKNRNIELAKPGSSPTKAHYQLLLKKLEKNSIYLIAMQYPTLKLEDLKKLILNDNENESNHNLLSFVSNEKVFLDALKMHPYEKLFSDRFKGSWGHTTLFGHELIAENVFQHLKKLIKDKKIQDK